MINNRLLVSAIAFVLVAGIGPSIESAFAVPGQGTLYATVPINTELWTIDPSNGVATLIGLTNDGQNNIPLPSLAVHPTTGVMYAGGGGGGGFNNPNSPSLFIVDPSSGGLTLVGATNVGNLVGLDFSADGTLFAAVKTSDIGMRTGGQALGIVNTATGGTTIVGSFGVSLLNGIAFLGNTLYGVSYNDELYTINTSTGEATLVTGVVPTIMLGAAQFACDGTLYVGEGDASDQFGTLDITTGDFTLILNTILGETIGGFAFIETCQFVGGSPVPIDTTSLLLAGSQMTASWMIPVIVAGIGIAIVIARKF